MSGENHGYTGSGAVRVLFLEMDNSGRSQMAQGLLQRFGGKRYEVYSAGAFPTELAPEAVEVMREVGVDISMQRAKSSREYLGQHFDHVFQICDQSAEACPVFPGAGTRTCWPVPDPAAGSRSEGDTLARYREARDRVWELMRETFGDEPADEYSRTQPVGK
ncbi:MAG: arsenate reductase ArsC [Chloroflexota bacterium]|nr:arsenate reductase ArsC [Chloroflexota bacterium]